MNERRLQRLKQLASGAALISATAVLPGCERQVIVNAPAPTPPSRVAPVDAGENTPGPPVLINSPGSSAPADPAPSVDAGPPPLRLPSQLNAPLPPRDAGVPKVPVNAPKPPIHVNSPPRAKPE